MKIEDIKKFASDACTVIDACQNMIADQEAEIAELKKLASAKPEVKVEKIQMDSDKLQKAASAVYELYGSPSTVSAKAIADAWGEKPELMLNVIQKFASEIMTRTNVSGAKIGETIAKKASEEPKAKADADASFWSKYNY